MRSMAGLIELFVLGPTSALVNGESVDLGGKRPRAVLAACIAAGGQGASQDTLVDTVWGTRAPATARKSVQKYVSRLRTVLSPHLIETTPAGYLLRRELASIDVDRLEQLADIAEQLLGEGAAQSALGACDEGLALAAKGEPFADLEATGAHAALAARYGELALALAEWRAEALLALGRNHEAIAAAEEFVAGHPLREASWGHLMLGLYRSGRQSEALRAYRRLERILGTELGIEPSSELRDLEQRILLHDRGLASAMSPQANLPASFTSFVGREREVGELIALIDQTRLITINGPGGSGKTRLAVETAATMSDMQAWFVDLARVGDAAQVPAALMSALGIAYEPEVSTANAIQAHLAGRNALLVIDNCEHVLGASAALVDTVLRSNETVRIVATSREPLGLTGEVVYALGPLDFPPEGEIDAEAAMSHGAVRLFAERAIAAFAAFSLADSLAAVLTICRRLDGIPLAIELAARQLAVMDVDEVGRGLLVGLDQLAAPGEPVARHRTLEAAIEWSYLLVDEEMRRFFAALSVFSGSFPRDAAARLWAVSGGEGDAAAHLDRLVAGSMVMRSPGQPASRYRILEPIRAYAAQRAGEMFTDGDLGRTHARWVLELFEEDTQIIGPRERETLRKLRAEDHHFSAALNWATENDPELALRLTIATSSYLWMVSYRFSWFDELQAAIEAGEAAPAGLRATALAHAGHSLAENFADHQTATVYANEAHAYAREHGDGELEVTSLQTLASASRNAGRLDEAIELARQTNALADEIGSDLWAIRALRWMAFTEMQRGNYRQALDVTDAARDRGEKLGSDWVVAKSLWVAAAVLALDGDYAAAEDHASRAFTLFEGYDDPASPVHVRAVQGDAARLAGDPQRASAIYEECLRGFQDVGDRRCTASTLRNLGLVNVQLGQPVVARRHLMAALEQRATFGDDAGLAECVEGLCQVEAFDGNWAAAAELAAAADALRELSGSRPPEPERRAMATVLDLAGEKISPDELERARDRGRHLATDQDVISAITSAIS